MISSLSTRAIPFYKVMAAIGQPLQAPVSFSLTIPSFTSTKSTLPPSANKEGLILSSTISTFSRTVYPISVFYFLTAMPHYRYSRSNYYVTLPQFIRHPCRGLQNLRKRYPLSLQMTGMSVAAAKKLRICYNNPEGKKLRNRVVNVVETLPLFKQKWMTTSNIRSSNRSSKRSKQKYHLLEPPAL